MHAKFHNQGQTFIAEGHLPDCCLRVKNLLKGPQRQGTTSRLTRTARGCKAPYLLDKLQKGDAGALLLWLVGAMHIKEDVDAHLQHISEWFRDIPQQRLCKFGDM